MLLKRIASAYTGTAIIWLTVCLLIVILNLVAFVLLSRPEPDNPVVRRNGNVIYDAYPSKDKEDVDRLLNEFFPKPSLLYEPYTQFKERPRNLQDVKVSGHGYRIHRPHGPWPIEARFFNVFVFGGSTTFGYGVPMDDTIPARLQAHLSKIKTDQPVRVYNFGRGFYFSVQERMLFETLLFHGHRPNLAIFIDGGNDTSYWRSNKGRVEPYFSGFFRGASRDLGVPPVWKLETPLQVYISKEMQGWDKPAAKQGASKATQSEKSAAMQDLPAPPPVCVAPVDSAVNESDAAVAAAQRNSRASKETSSLASELNKADPVGWKRLVDLWFVNKRITETLADEFGIETLFVWQPTPVHRYQAREYHILKHRAPARSFTMPNLLFEERVKANPPDPRLIVLSALQQDQKRNLYVDWVHYNPYFNDLIASKIAECSRWIVAKQPQEKPLEAPVMQERIQ